MAKKAVTRSVTSSASEVERLENLLVRLSGKVPGYPYELALACRFSWTMEKRMAEAAKDALRPPALTYVLYQALVIVAGGGDDR